MRRSSRFTVAVLLTVAVVAAAFAVRPAESQTPKAGGTLKIMHREDTPQGFAVHETATISTVWPSSPCFNNLVYFDPLKGRKASTRSSGSWRRSGRGRTTTATSSSSSART